jgi:hypothetical protein
MRTISATFAATELTADGSAHRSAEPAAHFQAVHAAIKPTVTSAQQLAYVAAI